MHASELNRRAAAAGDPIIAVSVHPGVIRTELSRNHGPTRFFVTLAGWFGGLKTIPQGAATSVHCVVASDVRGGLYYADCKLREASRQARDAAAAARLWALSDELVADAGGLGA